MGAARLAALLSMIAVSGCAEDPALGGAPDLAGTVDALLPLADRPPSAEDLAIGPDLLPPPRFFFDAPRLMGHSCCGVFAVASADFDADGHADVALLHGHYHFSSSTKSFDVDVAFDILDRSTWTAWFIDGPAAPTNLVPGRLSELMAAGDLDYDAGHGADLLGIDRNTLALARGKGPMSVSTVVTLTVSPTRVLVGDVSGDGKADAVIEFPNPKDALKPQTALLLGTAPARLAQPSGITDGALGNSPALADLDGDHLSDLVFLRAGPGAVLDTEVAVRAAGPAGFGAARGSTVYPTGRGHATALLVVDLDRDGALDAVVGGALDTGLGGGEIVVYRGDGHGRLGPPARVAVRTAPTHLAAADFDGDGKLDVAATLDEEPFDLVVLAGLGGGALGAAQVVDSLETLWLGAGDVDRDGAPDLVAVTSGDFRAPDVISFLHNYRH